MDFETLYRTHYQFIWRTLRRLGVSERDVEDTCQSVFWTAHRRLPQFEARSSIKTWLCGIALKVASDYRRSAVVRREHLIESPTDGTSDAPSQDIHVQQREQLEELDMVLAKLPVEQRTVLVLFELEQLTGEEIAAIEGVALGTVRSRLRLARESFSQLVSELRSAEQRSVVGGRS